MEFIGIPLFLITVMGGLLLAQYVFWRKTKRFFWRALLPYAARKSLVPDDTLKLDPWMVFEEWAAMLFLGSFLTLPMIALNLIGFLKFFS
jgi:hypothetical protein